MGTGSMNLSGWIPTNSIIWLSTWNGIQATAIAVPTIGWSSGVALPFEIPWNPLTGEMDGMERTSR